MSTVAFIRRMLDAGFTHDDALRAAEAFEATASEMLPVEPARSKGAERQARYRERHQASQSVTSNASDANPLPLPSSPQTPQQPTPTPGDILPARKGPKSAATDAEFDGFWAAYPAKVGIKAARTAWAKAKDRPALPEIIAAIERYRQSKPPDRDWCHPSTWLNQGRWEDQAPQPSIERPRHAKPDQQTARLDNFRAAWTGADGAAEMLAARRTF